MGWMRARKLPTPPWPTIARAGGLLLGGGSIVNWWLGGHTPDTGTMTFAAALLMAPNVAEAQRDRKDHDARRRRP